MHTGYLVISTILNCFMTIPVQWKGIYVTNERKMYIKRPSNF